MALAKLLLLQALLFSVLLLMVPMQCRVDPASTRPAISQVSTASLLHGRMQCTKILELADSPAVVPSLPEIIPGLCVPELCGDSGVIFKKSDTGTAEPCQFSPQIIEQPRDLSPTVSETMHKGWMAHAILGIVCGTLFSLLCFIGFGVVSSEEEDGVPHNEENLAVPSNAAGPTYPDVDAQTFSYSCLQTATNNFNYDNILGSGGFGAVFWARLSDNREVAVKRIHDPLGPDEEKDFKTELLAHCKARHDNVVDLIGYCTQNNELVLVCEFMSEGDLSELLEAKSVWQQESKLNSSWKLRVKILLDVAKGIEYLHTKPDPRIIHRDIKSRNILINKNWVAKISDFGFAVFGPEPGNEYVEVEKDSGTGGYMDPEGNGKLCATPRNDVYSFGVVMLEVITGQKAYDADTKLADSAPPLILSGKLYDVLYKSNRLSVPKGRELQALTSVAQLATECVKVPGVDRPDMTAVVIRLEAALSLFDPGEASTS